uniref:Uncharacterized protein n=1 Tax=Panagrolaimus davidi TaxID=227884 RepID=A0A914QQP9_9BILA
MEFKDWYAARTSFEKALALNPSSKESRDELSTVRGQIGIIARQDHLDPYYVPPETMISDFCSRLGITRNEFDDVLKKKAEEDPITGYNLQGDLYRDGIGREKDLAKAFEFYTMTAEKGSEVGMYNLGKMYNCGEGVKRDYEKSLYWFLKAANSKASSELGKGIVESQHAIGLKYFVGEGVEKDYQKAAEWYEKAAKNGCDRAATNLGNLYRDGLGVQRSPTKAFKLFKIAVECGNTTAMMNLADCYFNASGTGSIVASKEDIAEGMKWLKIAAEKGDQRAAQKLERHKNQGGLEKR